MNREIRDILAEAMRRERHGLMMPLWPRLCEIDDATAEHVRRRADHLIRLLSELGVTLVKTGDPDPAMPPPTSPIIWRYSLAGAEVERMVRKGPEDSWQIVMVEAGTERIEHQFTLAEAHIHAGSVLTGDPDAKKIPNLGKELAASLEAYRVDASTMEALK